jgi:uncharacterized protein
MLDGMLFEMPFTKAGALDCRLVYAHKEASPFHVAAKNVLSELLEKATPWALPWPVIHEFLSVTTNARVYQPASTVQEAFAFLESFMDAPGLRVLSEGPKHLSVLKETAMAGKIVGPLFHDARVAAICLSNGITELWSADRDFSRMKGLKIRNPLMLQA